MTPTNRRRPNTYPSGAAVFILCFAIHREAWDEPANRHSLSDNDLTLAQPYRSKTRSDEFWPDQQTSIWRLKGPVPSELPGTLEHPR